MPRGELGPGDRIGQSARDAEFFADLPVQFGYDETGDRPRSVKHAAEAPMPSVKGRQEMLEEIERKQALGRIAR